MLISWAPFIRLCIYLSIHLAPSSSSFVRLLGFGLRKALTVTWLWKVSYGWCSHRYSFIQIWFNIFWELNNCWNGEPSARCAWWEIRMLFLRNRNAQPVRIGWMFKYIYFYFYPLLVVEPILLLLLPFADGATMRRWCAQVLNTWQPVPQYDSLLNASDFALLASRCEQFCIICTAHCRA